MTLGILVISTSFGRSEEPVSATPVLWAKPVKQTNVLGKLLGKTMKTVSHKGATILPKISHSKKDHADKGAPETSGLNLFDPHRNESPIRTARLFKIQINPTVADPVAVPEQ
jgi:hypothetical protein